MHGGFAEIMIPVSQWNGSSVTIRGYSLSGTLVGAPYPFASSSLPKVTGSNGTVYYYIKANVTNAPDNDVIVEASSSSDAAVTHTLAALPQSDWNNFALQNACINKPSGVCINRNSNSYTVFIPTINWNGNQVTIKLYHTNDTLLFNQSYTNPVTEMYNGVLCYKLVFNYASYTTENIVAEVSGTNNAAIHMLLTPTQQICNGGACIQIKTSTFEQVAPICKGGTFTLPATSVEGYTGSWSPAINNTTTTTYTFVADPGQCASGTSMTVVVNEPVTPVFTPVAPIIAGSAFTLPTTSTNGITGSWSPAINNTVTTTYTFTPNSGQCAVAATLTVIVYPAQTQLIDLSSGKNADGSIMSDDEVPDTDWSYIDPNNNTSIPVTRYTYTGWSSASTGGIAGVTRWITGNNSITGYHYYMGKQFEIPEGSTSVMLNLRSLSFVRNWTYLVKKNDDGTETETLITQTSYLSDGAKGWLNTRSPEVVSYPLTPGKYFLKVKVYTNSSLQRQAIDVNAFVTYLPGISPVLTVDWTKAPNSYIFTGKNTIGEDVDGLYIPVKKAFAMWQNSPKLNNKTLTGKMTATVYWQDVVGLIKSDNAYSLQMIDSEKGSNAKIQVPIDKSKGYGNAVIALHMGESGTTADPVVWSWHVWVTDDPTTNGPIIDHTTDQQQLEFIRSSNSVCENCYDNASIGFKPKYMDRNLGATDTGFELNNATNTYQISLKSNKSGGLMYQWGRKDPIPPLSYRDGSFYDVIGEVGVIRSKDAFYKNEKSSPSSLRVFQMDTSLNSNDGYFTPTVLDLKTNIENSIKYPLKPVYNTRADLTNIAKSWFAGNSLDNLWSDNSQGKYDANGNLNSHVKGYLPKSSFDPCPNKWRMPSKLTSRKVTPIAFYPFGQNTFNFTEGTLNSKTFTPKGNGSILAYAGLKIFPSYGFDLTKISDPNRGGVTNMGLMPGTGGYELYKKNGKFIPYFSDTHESFLWTATIGNDNDESVEPVQMKFTPDPYAVGTPDAINYPNMIGAYNINFTRSSVNETQAMNACRCMQDPYADSAINTIDAGIYNFETEYFSDNSTIYYDKGINNPNSYMFVRSTSPRNIDTPEKGAIPINKAFSVYNNYLSDHGFPVTTWGNLKVNVYWTSDKGLITNVKLNKQPASLQDLETTFIQYTIGGSNVSGNALISLHDGSVANPVLWSWHIWVSNTDPTANAITYKTERDDILETDGILSGDVINYSGFTNSGYRSKTNIFMDRNLGAIDAFPNDLSLSDALIKIQNSGGLQYQWGRKDPIPAFYAPGYNNSTKSLAGVAQNIFRAPTGTDINGNLAATAFTETVTDSYFKANYAKLYSEIMMSGIGDKQDKIKNNLKKAIENPLTFIHQDIKNNGVGNDWLLDEPNAMADRWGHASEKSPFDPCPAGWRVPDAGTANALSDGREPKGFSPWYYGNYNADPATKSIYRVYDLGVEELYTDSNSPKAATLRISQYVGRYPGSVIKNPSNTDIRYGIVFGDSSGNFNIGNYPYTGVRGMFESFDRLRYKSFSLGICWVLDFYFN
ncbi:hypothetical protein [Epilithonimonas sp.]|uniref:hypothetical protein n=1 Tax=Epilithonimonas sp. TaxID=2894511 RepID=UPI0035B15101